MEKLTIQEEEVMIYIWELQCCFVKDIVAKYTQPAPPYTTVASIVKNLERKGYVTPKRVGNTGSSSNLVVISFLFQLSSSFLILLKVVDMFAFL